MFELKNAKPIGNEKTPWRLMTFSVAFAKIGLEMNKFELCEKKDGGHYVKGYAERYKKDDEWKEYTIVFMNKGGFRDDLTAQAVATWQAMDTFSAETTTPCDDSIPF